jgi:hypothetical protein
MWKGEQLRELIAAAALSVLTAAGAQAAMVDLVSGTSGTLNGAEFIQFESLGAGSGALEAFVRYGDATEPVTQGYNVDVARQADFQFNEVFGGFTRSLLLTEVPVVEFNGSQFREFCFDINEVAGDQALLSLDVVHIFLADAGNLLDYPTFPAGTTTLVYDMDAGDVTNHVRLDATISGPGSGTLDMIMLVPDSLFSGVDPSLDHLILYSRVGGEGGFLANSDNFEEWAVSAEGGIIPEPATGSLVAIGLAALAAARRCRAA